MGLRFRRRIKIAPGLYLNASTSGLGLSAGPRGATVSVGRRGAYLNTSVPGTGLYSRQRLGATPRAPADSTLERQARAQQKQADIDYLLNHNVTVRMPDIDGPIELLDEAGVPLPDRMVPLVWKHMKDQIVDGATKAIDRKREAVEQLGQVHRLTPHPSHAPAYSPSAFDVLPPDAPPSQPYHWFLRLFPAHRDRIDRLNDAAERAHALDKADWQADRDEHAKREAGKARMYQIRDAAPNHTAYEGFFSWHLQSLNWPKETEASFEVSPDCRSMSIDVDLPEVEDFPDGYQHLLAGGKKVSWKRIGKAERRRLYMHYVHGVALRLAGEAFAHLQKIQTITVSAFSQRPNKTTGAIEDQYLYSVRMARDAFSSIDFSSLHHVDPVAAFDLFEGRRKLSATGIFTPIKPFGEGE